MHCGVQRPPARIFVAQKQRKILRQARLDQLGPAQIHPALLRRVDEFGALAVFSDDDAAQGGVVWPVDVGAAAEEVERTGDGVRQDVDGVEDVEEDGGQAVVVVQAPQLCVARDLHPAVSHGD